MYLWHVLAMQVEDIMAPVILGLSLQASDHITEPSRMADSTAAHLTMLFDLPEICWSVFSVHSLYNNNNN